MKFSTLVKSVVGLGAVAGLIYAVNKLGENLPSSDLPLATPVAPENLGADFTEGEFTEVPVDASV